MTYPVGSFDLSASTGDRRGRGVRVPAGTGVRFVLLGLAVLGASTYLFQLLYMVIGSNGARFGLGLDRCTVFTRDLPPLGPDLSEASRRAYLAQLRCLEPQYHAMAAWVALACAVVIAVAVAIYLLHPMWIIRRRGLTPLPLASDSPLGEDLAGLCTELKVHGRVTWMLERRSRRIDGRAFGLPFRRRVYLTNGLVAAHAEHYGPGRQLALATVAHELAHLRNRDVDRTYLATGLLWGYLLVAVAPFVVWLARPSVSSLVFGHGEADVYGFRWLPTLIAFTILIWLLRQSVLRMRELEADAAAGTADRMEAAGIDLKVLIPDEPLGRGTQSWTSTRRQSEGAAFTFLGSGWTRWRSTHPDARRRREAARAPWRAWQTRPLEVLAAGITTGAFAASLQPFAHEVVAPLAGFGAVVTGMVAGVLLSGLVVIAEWRAVSGWRAERSAMPSTDADHLRVPARVWLPIPLLLSAGFLVGEPLTLVGAVTGESNLRSQWGSTSSVLITVCPLIVLCSVLGAWAASCALRVSERWPLTRERAVTWPLVALTAAAAVFGSTWGQVWFRAHIAPGYIVDPGLPPHPDGGLGWYQALARAVAGRFMLTEKAYEDPLMLLGPTLLGAVPLLILAWRAAGRADSRSSSPRAALTIAVFAAAGCTGVCAVLPFAAHLLLPREVLDSDDFVSTYLYVWTVIGEAAVLGACLVTAFRARVFRPAHVALALSASAVLICLSSYLTLDHVMQWGLGYHFPITTRLLTHVLRIVVSRATFLVVVCLPAAVAVAMAFRRPGGKGRDIRECEGVGATARHPVPALGVPVVATVMLVLVVLAAAIVGVPAIYAGWAGDLAQSLPH